MTDKKPGVAFFDLDHTLIPFDSDHAWGTYTTQLGWTGGLEFDARNDAFYGQYKAGTLNIHEYVRFATTAIRQHGEAAATAAHADFMRDVVQSGLRAEAKALLQQHRDAGDTLVIVTATNEFVTRPIAHALGVTELIAVDLQRGDDGWYSGDIRGTPSFREGKVTRVEQWLQERGLDWAGVRSSFYSDSINDLFLLEKVELPVATNPDARLRQLAQDRGWRILDLFQGLT